MLKNYDLWLVLLSFVVASIASYVALDLASRVSAARGHRAAGYWLAGGAMSMGAGIWAMHFVGMLAFSLPIAVSYDIGITLLSLLIAVGVSAFALYSVSRDTLSGRRLAIGGVLMGLGIVAMHYTGMSALQVHPRPSYDPLEFLASVVIAIVASVAALWISFNLRGETMASAVWRRLGGALIMGAAIAGMHYTGMAASRFAPDTICYGSPEALHNGWLATTVGLCTFLFLATTLVVSIFDARLAERTAKLVAQSDQIKKLAEAALGKEQGFLKALLDNLSEGIVACDESGLLTVFNRATREFHGLPEQPIPADRWAEHYDLFLADGQTKMSMEQIPLFRAFQGESIRDVEFVIAPRHRPSRTVVCNGQAIMTPAGEKLGAVVAMHDVTERKASEQKLTRYAQELERSNRDLEQFAYVASHDLQAPLRSIVGFCQILQEEFKGKLGEDADKYLHFSVTSATHMQSLIRDLLTFSRIGREDVEFAPVDCAAVLEHTKESLLSIIRESGATIHSGPLPVVPSSEVEIGQLFLNLIGNAIKFHSGRKPEVQVSARRDGGDWIFAVHDNGIGIQPEQQGRIFEIFQRLHRTEEYEGTGIGLAICRKVVERHGGRIWVESEAGSGSTFFFTLRA